MFGTGNLSGQELGGQYVLGDVIGIGGMASVYRALQTGLRREVAIKILPPTLAANPNYIARFTREAETAAALEHSHIVPVYDYGTDQSVVYVVMRLLPGGSLADRLTQRLEKRLPLPAPSEVVTLLRQIGDALDYAHRLQVIHRDIKPNNILFDDAGNAFLTDFGIAKLIDETATQLTAEGSAIGTPSHMSPEQWRGETVTAAADQYAVAVVIYTMLTGNLPFHSNNPHTLMYQHLNELPVPVHKQVPGIPPAVSDVVARALAKDRRERFDTIMDFAGALEAAAQYTGAVSTGFYTFAVESRVEPPQIMVPPAPGAAPAQQSASAPQQPAGGVPWEQPAYRMPAQSGAPWEQPPQPSPSPAYPAPVAPPPGYPPPTGQQWTGQGSTCIWFVILGVLMLGGITFGLYLIFESL